MTQCELPKEELVRRKELSDNTRKMIYSLLDVAAEDETSLMTTYRADLLSDSRARGVGGGAVGCGIVHSKSSCK